MNRTMPTVIESADDLKTRFHREHNPHKRERLQMLYFIASAQATRRIQLASLLGVSRNTLTRWLALYTTGGIPALLDLSVPPGKAPALTPDQLEQLRLRLAQPEGFASYGEGHHWIADTLGVDMRYHAVHTLVYDKLHARLKVARPSHEKKTKTR